MKLPPSVTEFLWFQNYGGKYRSNKYPYIKLLRLLLILDTFNNNVLSQKGGCGNYK